MKFPRNARIFRGQLDATPFVSVFFLLLIFILLGELLYVPGIRLELPRLMSSETLPGIDQPTISVAMDRSGQYFFRNKLVDEAELANDLRTAAAESHQPLTLIVQADKAVTEESLVRLALLAQKAGMKDLLLATLPGMPTKSPDPNLPRKP